MARRSPWTATLRRTLKALQRGATKSLLKATKQALRAGTKAARAPRAPPISRAPRAPPISRAPRAPAAKRAPRAKPATRTAVSSGTRWSTGRAVAPTGARTYRLFKPPGPRRTRPLLVLLHGCAQDAAAIALSTRVSALAAREGFIVMCPEQDRLANPQGCWNWFERRSGRALGEAAIILAAIDQACAQHGADPQRVVAAGLSAGASMAALLGITYPDRIQAVAMHSGIAPLAAQSAATALRAMQGHGRLRALATTRALPPLLVIQGTADGVVAPRNGAQVAQWWAEACDARQGPPRVVQRGRRRAATMMDFRVGAKRAVTLCEIAGLAHAWSGGAAGQPYSDPKGPDAMRMVWAFATKAFTARA